MYVCNFCFETAGCGVIVLKLGYQNKRLHRMFCPRNSLLTAGKNSFHPLPFSNSLLYSFPFVHFSLDTSFSWMDKRQGDGRQGGQLCGSGGSGMLCSHNMSCASPSRVLFCYGCPRKDWASLQCFIPWVTWHQLGGNLFLFSFSQLCYLSVIFGEKDAAFSLRSWKEGRVLAYITFIPSYFKTSYTLVVFHPWEKAENLWPLPHVGGNYSTEHWSDFTEAHGMAYPPWVGFTALRDWLDAADSSKSHQADGWLWHWELVIM